jgi:hypothetical protein
MDRKDHHHFRIPDFHTWFLFLTTYFYQYFQGHFFLHNTVEFILYHLPSNAKGKNKFDPHVGDAVDHVDHPVQYR